MANLDRKPILCDCGGSMKLDAAAIASALDLQQIPPIATQLCRSQLARFEAALTEGQPLLVACTQEAPLFSELAAHIPDNDSDLLFTNIRERAGWSDEGELATAKIAALLADAAVDDPTVEGVSFSSDGRCIILGHDETALETGKRLSAQLEVTVILSGRDQVMPPASMLFPIFTGQVRQATGWLGQYSLLIDGLAASDPSSRAWLRFGPPQDGGPVDCDLILDLTGGQPLFPAADRRDGYLRADPARPATVERAIFEASGLVGTFDKPRYVDFHASLCAHSRNRKAGCTRCLDVCPTGAIQPAGDVVNINPHICGGCGGCASVCPTGAASYTAPTRDRLLGRVRGLLRTYLTVNRTMADGRADGRGHGRDPVLLLHDDKHGAAIIDVIARQGRGLPAHVIPLSMTETDLIGLDLLLGAFAWGAAGLLVLKGDNGPDNAASAILRPQMEAILAGLAIEDERLQFIDATDPSVVEDRLWTLGQRTALADGSFLPMGTKRTVTLTAARLLAGGRSATGSSAMPRDSQLAAIPLPAGSSFGRVEVAVDGCTLCMACVSACPTGALVDGGDSPRLSFIQDACVQCGLCLTTCPEQVVSLHAELDLAEACRKPRTLKEEEPHHCPRCGKAFATQSGIERVIARLTASGHPLMSAPGAAERMRLCGDCRVIDQFETGRQPLSYGTLPRPRTGDDDLRDRAMNSNGIADKT